MKHNNVLPNQHFRKDWKRYVKTWFDQPARKQARRAARAARAARVAPRPINPLRPVVRGQTIRYNQRLRAGRGFSVEEVKAAGMNVKEAQSVGIAIDHRRRNRSEEGLKQNVQRLKLYRSKLVLFPRKPTSKRVHKADASKDERSAAKQSLEENVLPLPSGVAKSKARKITSAERDSTVYTIARKARTDAKLWGQRERRKITKENEKAGKGKKSDEGDAE